ncbi:MAG: phosphate/phosphite/phosphonate ABC transporter substrate-binding protein [Flavisolibacter sp.]
MISSLLRLKYFSGACILFTIVLCNGCRQKSVNYEPTYSTDIPSTKVLLFGVPTQSYYEIHDLFVKYLNEHLKGAKIQTVAISTFEGYMDQLRNRYFDLTIVNGMKALESIRNGYSIVGQVVETGYSGAILVNKDSAINTLSDLKGKTIATPGYPALGGHMLQMVYLGKNGFNVRKDIKLKYLESFESVFLNVYMGKCAAGFSTVNSWTRFIKRRPEISSKVMVKWTTDPMAGNAFLINNNVDKNIVEQLKDLILSMHETEEGKLALAKIGYQKFNTADSNSYQPVKDFLKMYYSVVEDSNR